MNERPSPDNEPELPEDPAPIRDPQPDPRFPKPQQARRDARPVTPVSKPTVTPLDEDEKIKEGIEIKET